MQLSRGSAEVGRRTVLGLGLASALALSGCGLRLDSPPQPPTPNSTDMLRNEIAGMLAATTASGGEATVLGTLRTAVGPIWTGSTASHTSQSPSATARRVGFQAGMQRVAETVAEGADSLSGSLAAVLGDVAVGAGLQLTGDSAAAVDSEFSALTPQPTASSPATTAGSASPNDADASLAAFVRTCFQASYGYQRLAVFVPAASDYGRSARSRLDSLAFAATAGNSLLRQAGTAIQGDQPAWTLPAQVNSESSARALAVKLESAVADAALPLFSHKSTAPFALGQLWNSAQARAQAGEKQTLRYTISAGAPAQPQTSASATATEPSR